LRVLLTRPGRIFTRAQIMDCVNIDASEVNERTIDSHIKNVRRKIEKVDPEFKCIATVYGVGYRFDMLE
jgi:two-component system response regulator BaeR